ncbi:MAG: hypothetical protein GF317_02920 [Candidatus Lokiarchaeota archaeon]|nr:hypothetical protein [Candidatus Lokiarchaeota archaeon]MBD3198859.1 hypothetical protein [Candidatus Lokiarchaeota archaeon]
MDRIELLKGGYTIPEARDLQLKYKNILQKQNVEDLDINNYAEIRYVSGVDVSYFTDNNGVEWGVACATLWNIQEGKLITSNYFHDQVSFPYEPGFLGFRECRLMAQAIKKLDEKPEVIMCDGHGIIHPRRMGEATHLGLSIDTSTFGVAKNPFVGYSEWKNMNRTKGSKAPVHSETKLSKPTNKELLGYAICLSNGRKPVFISTGYKISLKLTLKVALRTTNNTRQPKPLQMADLLSRQKVNRFNK